MKYNNLCVVFFVSSLLKKDETNNYNFGFFLSLLLPNLNDHIFYD